MISIDTVSHKIKKRILKKICKKPSSSWFFIRYLVDNKCVADINKILKFTESLNIKSCNFSSKGSFNIITEDYFYKIPITNTALTSLIGEKNNYQKYKKELPLCEEYYFHEEDITYMKMKIIKDISVNKKTREDKIYSFLNKQLSSCRKEKVNFIDYYEDCLVYLKKICNDEQYNELVQQLKNFSKYNYLIGFEHGDFHEGNILFEKKKMTIIDLDNANDCGLSELDVVHYLVISVSKQNKLPWTNQLMLFIKSNWFFENEYHKKLYDLISIDKDRIGLIYFFNKLKNDICDNNVSKEYSNLIIKFLQNYLEVYNVKYSKRSI